MLFAEKYARGFDLLSPLLRLKIYRIQCEFYARSAKTYGAVFFEPPAEALSPEGFLDPAFREIDPTHGNAAYGRLVIDQIKAVIGMEQDAAATGESA